MVSKLIEKPTWSANFKMSKKAGEAQQPEGQKVYSPKKFSKVRFLQVQGLLSRKFNYETFEFERSWPLTFVFLVSLILKPLCVFRTLISCFFPRNDMIQLVIGSVFNYLPNSSRFLLSLASSFAGIWALFFHFAFNYLNARDDYRLMRFWMKQTLELPVKNDRDYKVAGLSIEENKKFWLTENHINHIYFRVINGYICFVAFIFSSQLFFVKLSNTQYMLLNRDSRFKISKNLNFTFLSGSTAWNFFRSSTFCSKLSMYLTCAMQYSRSFIVSILWICSTWPVCDSSPRDSTTSDVMSRVCWNRLNQLTTGACLELSEITIGFIMTWFWSTTFLNSTLALIWSRSSRSVLPRFSLCYWTSTGGCFWILFDFSTKEIF